MSTAERSTPPREPKPQGVDETSFVPDHLVEAFTVTDPHLVRRLKAKREATGLDRQDEMWDGIYVVSPIQDVEHRLIVAELIFACAKVRGEIGGADVLPGLNISDQVEGWHKNYRIPDFAVYISGNPARNCGTHMCGGPDFAAEILSDNDLARKKLDFYAKVNTRELLFLDRDPWALELFRLIDGRLELVGTSTPDMTKVLTSQVLPLTFRLVQGQDRPTLELGRLGGNEVWRI